MPSVAYMNQSAPFWDFIASLEQQGSRQPPSDQNRGDNAENAQGHQGPQDPFAPWTWGHQFFGGGRGMPHRGGPPHTTYDNHHHEEFASEKQAEMNDANDNGEGPSGSSGSDNEARGEDGSNRRERHGRCGGGPRGRCGPGGRGGFGYHHGPGSRHGPGSHHGPGSRHGPHHGGRRGGWGPWARGGPFGGMGGGPFGFGGNAFDPSTLVAHLFNQFNDSQASNDNSRNNTTSSGNEDHTPEADIFDTESAYVVHISLPGAKKEDVGVNWDVEKSELNVAGVIYRPGDEEFLKTLAVDERKVGAFERKIRLGTRANPASIDADGITAKLEDGVLRVEVPKLDSGYVEIRKVDIQ
jgi:HSP20 family protein